MVAAELSGVDTQVPSRFVEGFAVEEHPFQRLPVQWSSIEQGLKCLKLLGGQLFGFPVPIENLSGKA